LLLIASSSSFFSSCRRRLNKNKGGREGGQKIGDKELRPHLAVKMHFLDPQLVEKSKPLWDEKQGKKVDRPRWREGGMEGWREGGNEGGWEGRRENMS